MTDDDKTRLDGYYEYVLTKGKLRTPEHARRWSSGVLKTLGTTLDRGTKRKLANALPEELAESLTAVFWLLHFRDPNLSSYEFRRRAARRSGNTDAEFALFPTLAVFGGIKRYVDPGLEQEVAKTLSPEVRELWQRAEAIEVTH